MDTVTFEEEVGGGMDSEDKRKSADMAFDDLLGDSFFDDGL
jgi:hypothetical protein